MNGFLDKLRELVGRLSVRQRAQLGFALVASLVLIWAFTAYVNRVRYSVLFSNLDRQGAGSVVAALKERKVDYRTAAGGTIVEVPAGLVDELRLELAEEGVPAGAGVGFELFDKPSFGLSDFVQNVNYRRALERELARTIQSLQAVESARVHLALPPESVFADEQRDPTASVVVRLRSGGALSLDRVRAIAHLVASGVEGLDPAHVSIIDDGGRMLSANTDDGLAGMSATELEAKRSRERSIESTLVAILEPLVGVGKVRATATVELNMTRVERVQESYDPAGAVVRSEVKSKQKADGGAATAGIPGTTSNLPGSAGGATAGGGAGKQESQTSTTNFEINKTVSTISEPVGNLARQSVAVVVDHAPGEATDASGADPPAPVPRSADEMQKITELVEAAIGYQPTRGDRLIVQNVAFDTSAPPVGTPAGGGFFELLLKIARYGSLPLAVLLLALLVIRPAIATLKSLKPAPEPDEALPPTVAQMQAQLAGGAVPALEDGGSAMRRKLIEAVQEDPRTAALVIRHWLERPKEKG